MICETSEQFLLGKRVIMKYQIAVFAANITKIEKIGRKNALLKTISQKN